MPGLEDNIGLGRITSREVLRDDGVDGSKKRERGSNRDGGHSSMNVRDWRSWLGNKIKSAIDLVQMASSTV